MALRFRYRHVHATLFADIRSRMIELGWGDSSLPANAPANATVNFGTGPATYVDYPPEEIGPVNPNTIVVTLGDEPAAEDLEMGSTFREVAIPLFVDVYGANQSIAVSIASDIKDICEDAYLVVRDHTQVPPAPTNEVIELDKDDVGVSRPSASIGAQDFKRYWRTVNTLARVSYLG